MTTFLIVATLLAAPTAAFAQFGANPKPLLPPHFNSDCSITQGYNATNPNDTTSDNYGASGNRNPYTGRVGGGRSGSVLDDLNPYSGPNSRTRSGRLGARAPRDDECL